MLHHGMNSQPTRIFIHLTFKKKLTMDLELLMKFVITIKA